MDPSLPKGEQIHFLHRKLSKRAVVFLALGLVASLSVTFYLLFFTGPTIRTQITKLINKESTVAPKTIVKNPFKSESQWVNPFDQSKSQFYSLKQKAAQK